MITNLRAAVVFLTRVPLGLGDADTPPVQAAVPWFPVVGVLIGAAAGGVYAGLWHVSTPGIAAVVAVGATVLVTGAFHLDGLGDVADGFAGGHTAERRLEIMRDSRLGTYGVAAVTLLLLAEVMSMSSLGAMSGFVSLLVAHTLARSCAIWMMAVSPPARSDGLGIDYLNGMGGRAKVVGSAIGPTLAIGLAGLAGLATVGVCVALTALMRRWARLAIGGSSGDVLGAIEQITEAASLLILASFFSSGHALPWWI